MDLRQPHVPGMAEATPPDALGVHPLSPGPIGDLGFELRCLLALPRGLTSISYSYTPGDTEPAGRPNPRQRPASHSRVRSSAASYRTYRGAPRRRTLSARFH